MSMGQERLPSHNNMSEEGKEGDVRANPFEDYFSTPDDFSRAIALYDPEHPESLGSMTGYETGESGKVYMYMNIAGKDKFYILEDTPEGLKYASTAASLDEALRTISRL